MAPTLRTWARWLIGVTLLLVALWIGMIGLILLAGARPAKRKADVILVLGAAQYNGRPSPVYRARLDHAIRLHRAGLAPYMLFTGGVGVGDTVSEGEVGRRYAEENGILPGAILVEREGLTTRESVNAAARLMAPHGLRSALIVSDSYHMLRAQLLAKRAGIDAYRAPTPDGPIDQVPIHRWRYVLRESVLFPATALFAH